MSSEPPPTPGPPSPPPVPPPPTGAAPPVQRNAGMLVLSYLGLLALIPLVVEKNDREVQWHAKHGLVLTVACVALYVAVGIVGAVAWFLAAALFPLVGLVWLIVTILCIVKALNGQRLLIPYVSEYADKF